MRRLDLYLHLSSEPIEVGYDPDSYTVSESDGSVTLTIRVFSHLTTGAPRPFTLAVNTADGTASMFLELSEQEFSNVPHTQLLLMVTMYQ